MEKTIKEITYNTESAILLAYSKNPAGLPDRQRSSVLKEYRTFTSKFTNKVHVKDLRIRHLVRKSSAKFHI